jgi:hypothetical protein
MKVWEDSAMLQFRGKESIENTDDKAQLDTAGKAREDVPMCSGAGQNPSAIDLGGKCCSGLQRCLKNWEGDISWYDKCYAPGAWESKGATCSQDSCQQDTGGTCSYFSCDASRGATCIDGKCMCQGGHCSANGMCMTFVGR